MVAMVAADPRRVRRDALTRRASPVSFACTASASRAASPSAGRSSSRTRRWKSRTTRSAPSRSPAEIERFDAGDPGGPEGAGGAARRDDLGRRAGRVRRLPRRALDDPHRSDAFRGAEADDRRAALQRRMGADAADERAGRAVRADRGPLPARAQGRRRAGGRARAQGPARQAGRVRRASAEDQTILVAHDLSPADVIQFKSHHFAAFLTDLGGATLAYRDRRAQPQRARRGGDAQRARPDPRARAADRRRRQERRHRQSRSLGARRVPAEAGRARARAEEAQAAQDEAARRRIDGARRSSCSPTSSCPTTSIRRWRTAPTGIGLFRSEFLFLNRQGLPSEDEQFEAYRQVAAGMRGKPVTIRTFDLGADKHKEGLDGLVARRAQSCAGLARRALLPGRAAPVPDAAPRDPARVALRQHPDPGADARVDRRDRPDAGAARAGQGQRCASRACRSIRRSRSAA